MASLKAARRNDPFRHHDPNAPHYSPRLSEEQWEALKARIANMHDAGWTCVDMLKDLKSIDVVVTRSQLDFRLKRWGLVKPKKQQDHHEKRELEGVALLDAPPRQRQPTNYDIDVLPTVAVSLLPDQVVLSSPWSSNPNIESLLFEGSGNSGTTHCILEGILQLGPSGTSPPERMGFSHPAKSLDPSSPTSSMFSWLSEFDEPDPLSTSSSQTDQSETLIRQPTCSLAQVRKARVFYPMLRLPPYELSSTTQDLWRSALSGTDESPERTGGPDAVGSQWRPAAARSRQILELLPIVAHTARLLNDLKCFGEAFEVWYLITSSINCAVAFDQLLGPQLMFAASTCARSARSPKQLQLADDLAEQLCHWRYQYVLQERNLLLDSKFRAELPSLLNLAERLLVESGNKTVYWATTHYSTKAITQGQQGELRTLFGAEYEEKSLWTKELRDWPKNLLDSLFVSYDVQAFMLRALDFIEAGLHVNSFNSLKIDESLGKYWPPNQDTAAGFAQAWACLVLEEYRTSTNSLPQPKPVPAESEEFFTRFEEQALGVLPFVLVHWVLKPKVSRDTTDVFEQKWPQCSDGLYFAVQRVRQALDRHSVLLKGAQYQEFVEVYLKQLTDDKSCLPSSRIFQGDRIVQAAAAMAGIAMNTQKENLERAPLKVLEVSSESDRGTEMSIGQSEVAERLSISSSIVDPPMARSYRSSMSSSLRALKALSTAIRLKGSVSNLSIRTTSTGTSSDHMSWRFSTVTGFSSSSSVRQSTASEIPMDGIEEEETSDTDSVLYAAVPW